ncbi:MAG TPA: ABC transporter permease subunit [Blastocatellia bacterium]|nr:ABC transporter permease subunit [Blastocatellia bacterium]
MRSHSLPQLVRKEWRELAAARAYWLLLVITGPLVGHSFITAVDLYAEASGAGGGPAALPQGLTPLDGLLVPTFGAYYLAVTLLFPFVAIRLIAAEKESGALKLLLQFPASLGATLTAKGLVLVAGWLVAWVPGLVALLLWKSYGGHLYGPETLNLLLGHLLHMALSGGVAVAAATLAESAASAAIVTLSFTLGTWALDFIAAGRGGWLQELALYTPTAALRVFEQGLIRLSTVIVILALSVGGFALAAIWLRAGRGWRYRAVATSALVLVLAAVVIVGARVRWSMDVSENRRNSFSAADEAALSQIREPLKVTAYLSPEDPRLTDLERSILGKLRRVLPRVDVDYAATSITGLFEDAEDHYGEIWYEMGGRKAMNRSTVEEIVLEQIYELAGTPAPERAEEEDAFAGYPLAARPAGASWIFYAAWPLATALCWWLIRK